MLLVVQWREIVNENFNNRKNGGGGGGDGSNKDGQHDVDVAYVCHFADVFPQ